VLAKLNEIKGEYNKKKQEEVRRIQLQLLKAKLEYFKKLTGEVLHQTSSSRKQEDFLSFLQLVANHNKDQLIAMVVDNAKIHRSQLIQDFLAKNERILYLPLYHLI
jgi:DDE superfamily endonuclease